MKKVLSVTLAVIIVLLTIPVSFATDTIQESENNNDFANANQVGENQTVNARFNERYDADVFLFIPSANGKLAVRFNHTYSEDGLRPWICDIYIYDDYTATYTLHESQTVSLRSSESLTIITLGLKKDTRCYIKVRNDGYSNWNPHDYSLCLNYEIRDDYEVELNNEFQFSNSIIFNQPKYANFSNRYDADFFTFTPTKNGRIELEFQHTYSTQGLQPWLCDVYSYSNSTYVKIAETAKISLQDSEVVKIGSFDVLQNTHYYIKIYNNGYSNWNPNGYALVCRDSSTTRFTLTYNANGGSVSPTSATVTAGNSVTLPTPTKAYTITYNANGGSGAPSAQKVNLTCKGWSTSSSATSAAYSCGSKYTPTGSTTLYAVWNNSASATISSTKPTRNGYSFIHWNTKPDGSGVSYTTGKSINLSGDQTLYAIWSAEGSNNSSDDTTDTIITILQLIIRPILFLWDIIVWLWNLIAG